MSIGLHAQTSLDTAANFTVKDVDGITHRLNEYLEQDKIVVIDFFTITCGPCTTYAPLINESYTHFGCNSSNVIFLGINWGGDNAGVSDFGFTYGVQYPEVSGTEGNGNHVVDDYGVLSYPTVILILPDSYIAEKYIWPPSTEHLDSIIIAYGGIASECTTPIFPLMKSSESFNRITNLFPLPASSLITCTTSVTSVSSLEVCSLIGNTVISRIAVQPGESTKIITSSLPDGYYMLMLRNSNGIVIDSKPFIIQKNK
jgi:thiol-disulfide isomerase/thioredoxin